MNVRTFLVACAAVTGLAGAAVADTPAQQEIPAADAEKWMTFFDKLVTTVVDSASTCDKLAVNVNALADANKDAIAIARTAKQQGQKLPADKQARMIEGVKKMVPGMQRCGHDQKVRAAFAKLDLNRKG
ncbi:MAG: hypothetical protein HOV81_06755 [Kofleriaceae bacterium]|nr:hypothetical protein [Kofleriaceae bacterium]